MFNLPTNRLWKQSLPLYNYFLKSKLVLANQQKFQPSRFLVKKPKPIVILDFETTGTSCDASIREIGAVKVEDGIITDSYHALVKPKEGSNLSEYAKIMTRTREAFPSLTDFCNDSYIVAHNAAFERRFLMQIYQKVPASSSFEPADVFCTYRIATKLFPSQENYKLSPLSKRLGLCFPSGLKSHRALDDAFKTKLLWDRCTYHLQERGVSSEYHQQCLFNIQYFNKDSTNQIIEYYAESSNNKNKKSR